MATVIQQFCSSISFLHHEHNKYKWYILGNQEKNPREKLSLMVYIYIYNIYIIYINIYIYNIYIYIIYIYIIYIYI